MYGSVTPVGTARLQTGENAQRVDLRVGTVARRARFAGNLASGGASARLQAECQSPSLAHSRAPRDGVFPGTDSLSAQLR